MADLLLKLALVSQSERKITVKSTLATILRDLVCNVSSKLEEGVDSGCKKSPV